MGANTHSIQSYCDTYYFKNRSYSQMETLVRVSPCVHTRKFGRDLGGQWISELFTELKVLKSPTGEIVAVRKHIAIFLANSNVLVSLAEYIYF